MVNKVIINIEQDNKTEAEFMSRSFVEKSVKNRAYINALGSELIIKYLSENGVVISELHNMHSISKILERIDISDIILPNIHMDVRVVFDENNIFIPKSHYNLGIVPDIYIVLKLDEKFESVEFLGYVESNKTEWIDQNDDYYFISKDKLFAPDSVIDYIKNYTNEKNKELSDAQMLKGRELSVSMADHDISEDDFKSLLGLLLVSDTLRNSLLEFDNFEILSYNAVEFINNVNLEENESENNPVIGSVEQATDEMSDLVPEEDETIESNLENEETEENETPEESETSEELDLEKEFAPEEFLDEFSDNELNNTEGTEPLEDELPNVSEDEEAFNDNGDAAQTSVVPELSDAQEENADSSFDNGNEELEQADEELLDVDDTALSDDIEIDLDENIEVFDVENEAEAIDNDISTDANETAEDTVNVADSKDLNSEEESIDENIFDENLTIDIDEPVEEETEPEEEEDKYDTGLPKSGDSGGIVSGSAILGAASKAVGGMAAKAAASAIPTSMLSAGAANISSMVAASDNAIKLAGMADDAVKELNNGDSPEKIDLSKVSSSKVRDDVFDNESDEINISEEVFDGDDTIEGITDDYDDIITEDFNPENETENEGIADKNENNAAEQSSETDIQEPEIVDDDTVDFEDDIFTQFLDDTPSQESAPSEYQEEVLNMDDLEPMEQNNQPIQNDEYLTEMEKKENSVVISDQTFTPGEIPIDINNDSKNQEPMQEELSDIYDNETENNDSILNNNVRIVKNDVNLANNKKLYGIFGAFIVLAIIGIIGFAVSKFMKPAQDNQPIVDNYSPENVQKGNEENPNALNVNPNNVVEMDKSSSYNKTANTNNDAIVRSSKPISPTSFIDVSKISWEVPDYVSYSPEFKQYFQSAGRSLKLALTSDLLLATEYAYSNQVKVGVTFDRSGGFKDSRIIQSSGSSQIDKIVLQTVNQTLRVLKAPPSLRDDDSTTVILKIYF